MWVVVSSGLTAYILGYGTLAYILSYGLLPAVGRYATPRKLLSQADFSVPRREPVGLRPREPAMERARQA